MQLTITLDGGETPEQINRCLAALSAYAGKSSKVGEVNLELRVNSDNAILELEKFKRAVGSLDIPESVGEKLEVELVSPEAPAFGKQPLPAEAAAGPLAPPAPPAPLAAGAAPSATAPEAATGSSAAPAAPPAPPAPPAAATQPPAPVGEVDKNGLPWDERIHSGNRAKVADGSWRMRRNVDPTKVAQVEAELRGQIPAAAPPPPPPPPAANPLDNLKPESAPPLPPAAPELTFGMVAKRVTAKLTLGELTTAELTKRLAELGFPDGLHTINARPDMWLTVLETLGA